MSYNIQSYDGHTFDEDIEVQLFMEAVANSGYTLQRNQSTYEKRVYANDKEKIVLNVPARTVNIFV